MSPSAPSVETGWQADLSEETVRLIAGLRPGLRSMLMADPERNQSQREMLRDAAALARAGLADPLREEFLRAKWRRYYRDIDDREIERAVERTKVGVLAERTAPRFPRRNPELLAQVLAENEGDLESLEGQFPNPGSWPHRHRCNHRYSLPRGRPPLLRPDIAGGDHAASGVTSPAVSTSTNLWCRD